MAPPTTPTVSPEQLQSFQDLVKVLDTLSKSLVGVSQGAGQTNAALGGQIDLIGRLQTATDSNISSQDRARQVEEDRERAREKLINSLIKESKQVSSLSDVTNVARKAWALYAKENKNVATAVNVAAAALKGLETSFKLLKAAAGGIFSVFSSLVESIFDIGAAIISIPFKFFDHIWSSTKKLMGGGTELAQAYENVREVFGSLKTGMGKDVVDLGKQLTQGLITPGLSARRVFGDMAEAMEYAKEVASAAPFAFQKIADQFDGASGTEILAMAKGLGIATEDLGGLMNKAVTEGRGMEEMLTEVTKYAKGMGEAFGLNSKMISRDMGKAMKDVKHFANMTEKEIAEATVYAHKLGVSLSDITGILDNFNTFEQASENVSKLSQAFGVNIDAMKLLEAKSPADALDMLKSSFAAAGKSVETMNRQELQLIAQSVGMSEEAVRQTMSMKNVGVSMGQVKTASSSLEKQTMDTNQALRSMSEDIKRVVKAGQVPEGEGFFAVFLNSIKEGHDKSEPLIALYKTMSDAIKSVVAEGRLLGVSFVKYFPGYEEFIRGLTQKMSTVGSLFADIRISFENFFKSLDDPSVKNPVERLFESLRKNFENFFGGKGNSGIMSGLEKMWVAAKKIIAEGIKVVSGMLVEGIKTITSMLKGEKVNPLAGSDLGKKLENEVAPIGNALTDAFNEVGPALKELLKTVFDEAWKAISTEENQRKLGEFIKNSISYAWDNTDWSTKLVIFAGLFGPAMVRGLVAAMAGTVFKEGVSAAFTAALKSFKLPTPPPGGTGPGGTGPGGTGPGGTGPGMTGPGGGGGARPGGAPGAQPKGWRGRLSKVGGGISKYGGGALRGLGNFLAIAGTAAFAKDIYDNVTYEAPTEAEKSAALASGKELPEAPTMDAGKVAMGAMSTIQTAQFARSLMGAKTAVTAATTAAETAAAATSAAATTTTAAATTATVGAEAAALAGSGAVAAEGGVVGTAGVAAAGGIGVGAAAAGGAAVVGVLAAAYESYELYQDVRQGEKEREEVLASTQTVLSQQTQTFKDQEKLLKQQNSALEDKLALGEISTKQAEKDKKQIKETLDMERGREISRQVSGVRASITEAQKELNSLANIDEEAMTASIDNAWSVAKKAMAEGMPGATEELSTQYSASIAAIKQDMISKVGEGLDAQGNFNASTGIPSLLEQMKNQDVESLEKLATKSVDELETSGAEWTKAYNKEGLDLTSRQASYVKLVAQQLILEKKAAEEKKNAAAKAKADAEKADKEKAADEARRAADREKKQEADRAAANAETLQELGLDTKWTPKSATEAIKKVNAVAKDLGAADIEGTMKKIREKMDKTDFRVVSDPSKMKDITDAMIALRQVVNIFSAVGDLSEEVKTASTNSASLSTSMTAIETNLASINKNLAAKLRTTAETFATSLRDIANSLTIGIPEVQVDQLNAKLTKVKDVLNDYSKVAGEIDLGRRSAPLSIKGAKGGKATQMTPYAIPVKDQHMNVKLEIQVNLSTTDLADGLVKTPGTIIRSKINDAAEGIRVDGSRAK